MADMHTPTPELMKQIADQCRVVTHLATEIAAVHADYEMITRDGGLGNISDIVGSRTASFMETLGDMLNGMDAALVSDEWTHPIFKEAQRLWPVAPSQDAETIKALREALERTTLLLNAAGKAIEEHGFNMDFTSVDGIETDHIGFSIDCENAVHRARAALAGSAS